LGFNLTGDVVDSDSITVTHGTVATVFIRGDADLNRTADLTDAIGIMSYLFLGGSLSCLDAGDVDDNGRLEITDAVLLLNYLFLGGNAPAAPFAQPGVDP